MANRIKYIIIEVSDGETTEILPIVFPCSLVHKEMYRAARNSYYGTIRGARTVNCVAAGFVRIDNSIPLSVEAINVFDKSESLGIDSRPEDAKLIYNMLIYDRQVHYEAGIAEKLLS